MSDATVVVTRYSESNELIMPCLIGLSKQRHVRLNIFFLDQKLDEKIKHICESLSGKDIKIEYIKIPAKSLSFARNYGIKNSKTDKILFIDSDAIPDENWAFNLIKLFTGKIAIVGGKSKPKWLDKERWFTKSNIAREVYSLLDLGDEQMKINKIVGVNFGLNKKILGDIAHFNETLGRRPGSLLGGEETELCNMVISSGYYIVYSPKSIVEHQVQKERISLKWLMKRFYYGGLGKAIMKSRPQTYSKKRNFYDYLLLLFVIVPYGLGYFRGLKK